MQYLLVEPVAKTPYPPLGLMKISSMLKSQNPENSILFTIGTDIPPGLRDPSEIYVTSLFTWDIDKVVFAVNYFKKRYPSASIKIGGIAASLLPTYIESKTGIRSHVGILKEAEFCSPDYSLNFGRKIRTSITMTTRGCVRQCTFCNVKAIEPMFFTRNDWEKDISLELPYITFWDNNWLASPNLVDDCNKLRRLGKRVDFNQGLDARLYNRQKAQLLAGVNIDPIRFAFDGVKDEHDVVKAIKLAKKYSNKEIRVYVLYNYDDTPEDFYHRLNVLNQNQVLAFPMEYREPTETKMKFPGRYWDTQLLRGMKLSLLFYYRKGMITESRTSFLSFYGKNAQQFTTKLREVYRYDKTLGRTKKDTLRN